MNDPLQKNAIDLIQLGFEDYFLINQDKRRILTAIRNIYAGILLLLKAELKIRSPKNFGDILIKKQYAFAIINENIVVKSKGVKTIGLYDMKDRYRLLNLNIKDHLNELDELSKIRNEIEHHFTQFPKETLETSILKAFWIIKKFNDEYCQLDCHILFTMKTWIKLTEIEEAYTKLKNDCMNRWKNLDYNNISRRIFPIEQENRDKNANAVILDFFSSIECPNCQSDLIEPITHNFNKNIDVNMKCVKCNNTFDFSQIIEEVLEKYYAYEIMKAGAKGGVVPLSQCPKCHLGTFLSYENICIYCGNTIEDTYNPEFANELFIRNVNDYWDYTS